MTLSHRFTFAQFDKAAPINGATIWNYVLTATWAGVNSSSGLSMGGVYGYIDSKDQLAEMIEDVVRHAVGEVPRWFAHIADPRARLEGIVRASIYLSESLQPWFYFVYMDSRVLPLKQRKMAKQSELSAQETIEGLLDDVAPSPGNSLLAAHCLAMTQDWYLKRWKYKAAKVDVDAFADSIVAMVCR